VSAWLIAWQFAIKRGLPVGGALWQIGSHLSAGVIIGLCWAARVAQGECRSRRASRCPGMPVSAIR
jgi:hypothetical protein